MRELRILDLPEDNANLEDVEEDASTIVERSAWDRHPPFEGCVLTKEY